VLAKFVADPDDRHHIELLRITDGIDRSLGPPAKALWLRLFHALGQAGIVGIMAHRVSLANDNAKGRERVLTAFINRLRVLFPEYIFVVTKARQSQEKSNSSMAVN